jgi:multidrug resistance efflux pump
MFRFTIRDVLWLTVVVAVALAVRLAWMRDHEWQRQKHQETDDAYVKLLDQRR